MPTSPPPPPPPSVRAAPASAEQELRGILAATLTRARIDQLLTAVLAEHDAARTADPTADRCPACICDNCGGRLDQHTATGCSCDDCTSFLDQQCSLARFEPSERIFLFAQQIGPLLSVHLSGRAQRRCAAVAHAAHHALRDYDDYQEALRG